MARLPTQFLVGGNDPLVINERKLIAGHTPILAELGDPSKGRIVARARHVQSNRMPLERV